MGTVFEVCPSLCHKLRVQFSAPELETSAPGWIQSDLRPSPTDLQSHTRTETDLNIADG